MVQVGPRGVGGRGAGVADALRLGATMPGVRARPRARGRHATALEGGALRAAGVPDRGRHADDRLPAATARHRPGGIGGPVQRRGPDRPLAVGAARAGAAAGDRREPPTRVRHRLGGAAHPAGHHLGDAADHRAPVDLWGLRGDGAPVGLGAGPRPALPPVLVRSPDALCVPARGCRRRGAVRRLATGVGDRRAAGMGRRRILPRHGRGASHGPPPVRGGGRRGRDQAANMYVR